MAVSTATMSSSQLRGLLLDLDARIIIRSDAIVMAIDRSRLVEKLGTMQPEDGGKAISLVVPASLVRRGRELRLALAPTSTSAPMLVDPILINLIVRAEKAQATLFTHGQSIDRLRRNELARFARLRTLAPDIISAIVEGR